MAQWCEPLIEIFRRLDKIKKSGCDLEIKPNLEFGLQKRGAFYTTKLVWCEL